MPSSTRSATLGAPLETVYDLISTPDHMTRWYPGVTRVEGVTGDRFTLVMPTKQGRGIRVDFRTVEAERPSRYAFTQEIEGSPFERVLTENLTTIELFGHDAHTHVSITQRQRLRGYALLGGWMLRRSNRARLDEALAGLLQVFGDGSH